MPIALPPDTPASAQRRAALARKWLSPHDVMGRLGVEADELERLRNKRLILAVWHAPVADYRYPTFQFIGDTLSPHLATLLELITPVSCGSGWGEIEWLWCRHALLAGKRPAEVFEDDPTRIVEVATREFMEERDAGY